MLAFIFGIVIFIDDYFNSLTVGTIMRPVFDKTKTSRAKLAYILDSTAAPVCILAPISSWVVTVMSIVRQAPGFMDDKGNYLLGINEFQFFIKAIPFNLYAITTLIMVLAIIIFNRDFGPMKQSEMLAATGQLYNEKKYGPVSGNVPEAEVSRAKPFDMLFPIIVLIITAVAFFPITTWIGAIDGEKITTFTAAIQSMSIGDAFNNTDSSKALMYAIIITIVISYIYYLARGLMNLSESGEALRDGIKSMVPALIILTMAWSIGTIIKSPKSQGGLGLGYFLSESVAGGKFPIGLLPGIMFVLSALISFATGTSWGTFGIMIPIAMPIITGLAQAKGYTLPAEVNATMITIAGVLSGAVFGDHASPISDTTILSSTGAGVPHLEHVATQMPYAVFVAICSLVGFIVGGLCMNLAICWIATLVSLALGLVFLPKLYRTR
jgi:Na+/H+ antiporter NhaC